MFQGRAVGGDEVGFVVVGEGEGGEVVVVFMRGSVEAAVGVGVGVGVDELEVWGKEVDDAGAGEKDSSFFFAAGMEAGFEAAGDEAEGWDEAGWVDVSEA